MDEYNSENNKLFDCFGQIDWADPLLLQRLFIDGISWSFFVTIFLAGNDAKVTENTFNYFWEKTILFSFF